MTQADDLRDRLRQALPGLRFAYLDIAAVVLVLPIVLLAGAPVVGYLAGAGVWIGQRAIGLATDRLAARAADPRRALITAIVGLCPTSEQVTVAVAPTSSAARIRGSRRSRTMSCCAAVPPPSSWRLRCAAP